MFDIPLGRFTWYECYSDDPNASKAFYSDLVGWGEEPFGPEGVYTVIKNGDRGIGGYMKLTDEMKEMGAPPHWLIYVATPNADDTAAKAADLGGTIVHAPFDIPEVGRIVVLADPQGAVFCAFQPAGDAPGRDEPAEVGDFSWHELMTTDWEGAWKFYSELFGWQKTEQMDMGEMGMYQMYGRGAQPLGGMFNKPPEVPVSAWLFYIRVPSSVEDAVEKVKAAGGQILNGPMEVPGGSGDMIAQCVDPQGVPFAIHATA